VAITVLVVVEVVGSLGFLVTALCFVDEIWVAPVGETVFTVVVSSVLLVVVDLEALIVCDRIMLFVYGIVVEIFAVFTLYGHRRWQE
jgi:hypothetical protein